MSNVIIAPTHGYRREEHLEPPADMTDAAIVRQRMNRIIPIPARKSPLNTDFKQYQDMRMIHTGNQHAEDKARGFFSGRYDTIHKNGISFPDNGEEQNMKYLRGMNNLDYHV